MPDPMRRLAIAAASGCNTGMRFRSIVPVFVCCLLAACAHAPRNALAHWVPSPNYNARGPVIVVLHATEQDSVADSLHTLRTANSGGRVSAHYLIGRDGARYQLVADEDRAWHAGSGHWGTITDLNSASIGIELDNDGSAEFPAAQIGSLLVLLDDVCKRHDIPRAQVIAHADLAPTRKRDPGARFPWRQLADAGYGLWPRAPLSDPPAGFDALEALQAIGYPIDDPAAALRAFRLHFRGLDAPASAFEPDRDDLRLLFALRSAR